VLAKSAKCITYSYQLATTTLTSTNEISGDGEPTNPLIDQIFILTKINFYSVLLLSTGKKLCFQQAINHLDHILQWFELKR